MINIIFDGLKFYNAIAIESPWVVPSCDRNSLPLMMNNLEGITQQLLRSFEIAGHKYLYLHRHASRDVSSFSMFTCLLLCTPFL